MCSPYKINRFEDDVLHNVGFAGPTLSEEEDMSCPSLGRRLLFIALVDLDAALLLLTHTDLNPLGAADCNLAKRRTRRPRTQGAMNVPGPIQRRGLRSTNC